MARLENRLLAQFPTEIRNKLASQKREVNMANGQVLHLAGQPIDAVFFPTSCLISITVTMENGAVTEVGLAGSREMAGLNAFMGGRETTQTEYVVQSPGLAVRVPADLLLEDFDRNKALRDVLLRYTQAHIAQLSQNVGCNRHHTLNKRLARWLLEVQERLGEREFPLSHEFISQMIGVRRAGVTEGLGALASEGMISQGRKSIKILDLAGLKASSCECFALLQTEYDRLLGIQPA